MPLPTTPSIFFKFQGATPAILDESQKLAASIASKFGAQDMVFAKDAEESRELWDVRKMLHWTILAMGGEGSRVYSTGKLLSPCPRQA